MIDVLNQKRALTISEAAEYACVSRGTILSWIQKKLLPFEELPGRGNGSQIFRRIRRDDLDKFLNQFYHKCNLEHKKKLNNDIILLPKNS